MCTIRHELGSQVFPIQMTGNAIAENVKNSQFNTKVCSGIMKQLVYMILHMTMELKNHLV